jgi:hypothetical protein
MGLIKASEFGGGEKKGAAGRKLSLTLAHFVISMFVTGRDMFCNPIN